VVEKLKREGPSALVGRWTHAHERDEGGARVFVGPTVRLGLSRGRRVLEFDDAGGFIDTAPGPTDRVHSRKGRYRVEGNELVLNYADDGEERLTFELAGDGTLRLRK
jgi:hypothetical protein